jgi:uncharacterized protein (TIGR02996 family)
LCCAILLVAIGLAALSSSVIVRARRMSFLHHTPDIDVVPCMGCDSLIGERDLFQETAHYGRSCCFWHPHHYWCIRSQQQPHERKRAIDICGDCGEHIDRDDVIAMLRWRAQTFDKRLHKRTIDWGHPDGTRRDRDDDGPPLPRELGLRFVRVLTPGTHSGKNKNPQPLIFIDSGDEQLAMIEDYFGRRSELVHDRPCFADHDNALREWLTAARDPNDVQWREVFADWLEENDRTNEALFVRTDLERRSSLLADKTITEDLDHRLRQLRKTLSGGFCRAIIL